MNIELEQKRLDAAQNALNIVWGLLGISWITLMFCDALHVSADIENLLLTCCIVGVVAASLRVGHVYFSFRDHSPSWSR